MVGSVLVVILIIWFFAMLLGGSGESNYTSSVGVNSGNEGTTAILQLVLVIVFLLSIGAFIFG